MPRHCPALPGTNDASNLVPTVLPDPVRKIEPKRAAVLMQTIVVNGVTRQVQARADSPLLYVLRNELGVMSPKFGCGVGDCGACAVLQDGSEIRSCLTPVGSVSGDITTLEGLPRAWAIARKRADAETATECHPVQRAWIEEQVPQCGYCQSGMIIAAVDLLTRIPDPSVAEVKQAFSGPNPHLCRCGTYRAILRAVMRAARDMT
jgi:isoquinoline 1-oxidoreductase alpha subunit